MLRCPRHPRAATALAAPARLLSSSPSSLGPDPSPTSPPWPHFQRRSHPKRSLGLSEGQNDRYTTAAATSTVPDAEPRQEPRDPRVMLILRGLSPSLVASDFYRLAPSDLSSWQSAIKKIQQQRDATTLEPTGQYNLSFFTGPAAMSYRDRLLRLHRLAHHRLANPHGLWESLVPLHLRSPAGDDPAAELEGFTVTSGSPSHAALDVQRRRVANKDTWSRDVARVTAGLGYGEKPPVVLVRVYPPTVTTDRLAAWIREDGLSRGCEWEVRPVSWSSHGDEAEGDGPARGAHGRGVNVNPQSTSTGRFIVACASDVEARRFHRCWNQRVLPAGPETTSTARSLVHASIINW
ncbi:hypothetical protein E4U53_007436 [Claviceps sorghi]|nr:hypothetical protein E4U53_007436 [Claviceps sorghi]